MRRERGRVPMKASARTERDMPLKIAVYGICKNELHNVGPFLENTKDADCVVICDTGSTDNTPWRVSGFEDARITLHHIHVEPFRFDVARNAALALVPADVDVCVSLDLDERLEPDWRAGIERAWAAYPDTTKLGVRYQKDGMQEFIHNSRVHKRNGYYWKDPCHEAIYPWMSDDNVVVSKSVKIVHHPDLQKPRDRLNLLTAGIMEEPWNRRRMFYYGRELVLVGENEKALGWLYKYLQLWIESGEEPWMEVEQAQAYVRLAQGVLTEQSVAALKTSQSASEV